MNNNLLTTNEWLQERKEWKKFLFNIWLDLDLDWICEMRNSKKNKRINNSKKYWMNEWMNVIVMMWGSKLISAEKKSKKKQKEKIELN